MGNPWLVCAVEGCLIFGKRFRSSSMKFCTECGTERTGTLPSCCDEEGLTDLGYCGACGTKKVRLGLDA